VTQMDVLDIIGKGLEHRLRKQGSGVAPVGGDSADFGPVAQGDRASPAGIPRVHLGLNWQEGRKTAAFNTAAAGDILAGLQPVVVPGPFAPVPVTGLHTASKVLNAQELKTRGVAEDVVQKIAAADCDVIEGSVDRNKT